MQRQLVKAQQSWNTRGVTASGTVLCANTSACSTLGVAITETFSRRTKGAAVQCD
jgi:hypothetical protein